MKKITRCISLDPRTDALLKKDSENRYATVSANLSRILWEHYQKNPIITISEKNLDALKVM
jgi:hypothetical protein|tara:strand:+ start:1792 stop:1974 length:183 start_codon:yes stop_codon:yes gene_type:complete